MQIIDRNKPAAEIKAEIAAEVAKMVAAGQKRPHLVGVNTC